MPAAAPLAPDAPAGLDAPAVGLDALPPVDARPPGLAEAAGSFWADLREALGELAAAAEPAPGRGRAGRGRH